MSITILSKEKGYSLLELSIVIAIIGFIIGNLLSLAADKTEADRIKETNEKMEYIEKAIAYYLAEYGSIPCPGDPTIPSNGYNSTYSTTFGQSSVVASTPYTCYGATNHTYSTAFAYSTGATYTNESLGMVPTATLQISDDYAYDGWGRRFKYAMYQNLDASNNQYLPGYGYGGVSASNPIYNAICSAFSPYTCGTNYYTLLTINNASGTATVNAKAAYVLISHGKNGHGAYPHNGGGTRITATGIVGTNEVTNALLTTGGSNQTTTGTYVQQAMSLSNSSSTYFDDIVHYRTKDQLIKEAGIFNSNEIYSIPDGTKTLSQKGAIYSQTICSMAANITSTTVAKTYCPYCSSAATCSTTFANNCPTTLYNLASQINALCL